LVAAPPTQLQAPRTPPGRTDRQRAVEEVERGRALYKERAYHAAVAAFENALRIDPTWPDAALRLGMAHEDDKQYRKAIEAYERCLRIDPQHHMAATNIGEALRKSEKYEEAVRAYDRALAMKPDWLYALAGRAECMRMLKDYQGCLWWFDKALGVGPRHAFAIQGKAAALNSLQQWADALPLWDRALELEPQSTFAREGKVLCERNLETAAPEVRAEPESATPVLDEQGRDLTALARAGASPPVVGRDTEIRAVMKTLVRRLKANPLLLGEPGVGKTAVVEGVAQASPGADAPARLRAAHHRAVMGTCSPARSTAARSRSACKEVIVRPARGRPGCPVHRRDPHARGRRAAPRAARSTPPTSSSRPSRAARSP
jgi:tetratricopeptide (TPR) repeat protein